MCVNLGVLSGPDNKRIRKVAVNVLELGETGVEFGAKVCSMRPMSKLSSNPMTICLCKVNPVNTGIGEVSGMRWA